MADLGTAPRIASLANGGHVVVWSSGRAVLAQRFDVNGQKVGSEITVFPAPASPGVIDLGSVAGLPDGSFVVSAVGAGHIFVQRVNASGQLVASGGTTDPAMNGGLASIVPLDSTGYIAVVPQEIIVNTDGSYALVLQHVSGVGPPPGFDEKLQRFDAAGNPQGAQTLLLQDNFTLSPRMAQLAAGNIVMAGNTTTGLTVRVFSPTGTVVGERVLNGQYGHVAALADGTAVLLHRAAPASTTSQWQADRLDASGNVLATVALPIEASDASITAMAGGGYLVTWGDPTTFALMGRYLTSAGAAVGDSFVISSDAGYYRTIATATGFVVTYETNSTRILQEIAFTKPPLS